MSPNPAPSKKRFPTVYRCASCTKSWPKGKRFTSPVLNLRARVANALFLLFFAFTNGACSSGTPALVTYEKDGVSFVHFADWKVTDDTIIEETTRSRTLTLEGPSEALVSFVLLPSSADLQLEAFASSIARARGSAIRESLSIGAFSPAEVSASSSQAASAEVGGQQRSGIQQHYSITLLGQEVPHEARFFLVPGPAMTAIIMTQVASEHAKQIASGFSVTLSSFRLGRAQ